MVSNIVFKNYDPYWTDYLKENIKSYDLATRFFVDQKKDLNE